MGTYTGTALDEEISPYTVSPSVTVTGVPRPSAAADTINGLGGNDVLDGGGGADAINGGDGNDSISDGPDEGANGFTLPNAGNIIHGGAGNDAITIAVGDTGGANPTTNSAYGDAGNDIVAIQIGDFYLLHDEEWVGAGPTGAVFLHGGTGDDALDVTSFVLTPGMTPFLYGEGGSDTLRATAWVWEPDGSYSGGNNRDNLYGGAGDDTYWVAESKDLSIEKPGEGTDTVDAVETDYVLPANVENLHMTFNYYPYADTYSGTGNALNNVITVDDGSPTEYPSYHLNGMGGDDEIHGSPGGDDEISGDTGSDTLYGDLGNDTISGQDGNDRIYGGRSADDPADGADTIYADAGNDDVWAGGGGDLVYGGSGDDNLYSQSGNDTVRGGAGNDQVYGGSGTDVLYGEDGVDTVRGGDGADRCDSGAGNDLYDYDYVSDSAPGAATRDVILAFAGIGATVGDRVDLATIDANGGVAGNQAFVFRGTAAIIGADQVNVVASGSDTLIRANTGGSLAPELEILVRDAAATPGQWVAGDFIL